MTEQRPFQLLQDRLRGEAPDQTLHDGVREWMVDPLREWLKLALDEEIARRVILRLRWKRSTDKERYTDRVAWCDQRELLTVVDAVLQLHMAWNAPDLGGWGHDTVGVWSQERFVAVLVDLTDILIDCASCYRVDIDARCLVRRVNQTAQAAVDATIKDAPRTAGDHLRVAWVAAYGLSPEPDKVFNEAIRAVEEVACPLVEQKKTAKGLATLGTVIGELKNSGHVWELVLPAKDGTPRTVESLVSMMETLWDAQRSRHGGGPNSRRQTQAEAEAAVHLAVLLVQWLTAGALRRTA